MGHVFVWASRNVIFLFLAGVLCQEAVADSVTGLEDEIRWLQEERYVTTATKTREQLSKSGASVSVITANDLQKMGARNLMDALKRLPGFGINKFNMGMSSVEVRGVKTDFSEKVLFLLDGHGINNNLVNGGALSSYNNIRLNDVKVVEVIRGPGSALYGANAFSAVINVITKKAEDISGLIFSLEGGSDQTQAASLLYGGIGEGFHVATSVDIYESAGLNSHVSSDALGRSGNIDHWQRRYEWALRASINQFSF
ncbi:MAG: TonB-dependent receptor plug domain-containing protein [Pseudomonadales bacterium]|nr:TonB-dependent receptor plug domain-containing protein [Pseudomonadales bacterium]